MERKGQLCLSAVHCLGLRGNTLRQKGTRVSVGMRETTHVYIWCNIYFGDRHKPLLYGNSRKTPTARVLRWAVRLQGYDYKVQYIQGKRNPSDILSRQPTPTHQGHDEIEQSIKHIIAHAVPKAVSLQDIISEANKDRLFQNVIECVNTGQWKCCSWEGDRSWYQKCFSRTQVNSLGRCFPKHITDGILVSNVFHTQ